MLFFNDNMSKRIPYDLFPEIGAYIGTSAQAKTYYDAIICPAKHFTFTDRLFPKLWFTMEDLLKYRDVMFYANKFRFDRRYGKHSFVKLGIRKMSKVRKIKMDGQLHDYFSHIFPNAQYIETDTHDMEELYHENENIDDVTINTSEYGNAYYWHTFEEWNEKKRKQTILTRGGVNIRKSAKYVCFKRDALSYFYDEYESSQYGSDDTPKKVIENISKVKYYVYDCNDTDSLCYELRQKFYAAKIVIIVVLFRDGREFNKEVHTITEDDHTIEYRRTSNIQISIPIMDFSREWALDREEDFSSERIIAIFLEQTKRVEIVENEIVDVGYFSGTESKGVETSLKYSKTIQQYLSAFIAIVSNLPDQIYGMKKDVEGTIHFEDPDN